MGRSEDSDWNFTSVCHQQLVLLTEKTEVVPQSSKPLVLGHYLAILNHNSSKDLAAILNSLPTIYIDW